jgi:hypothetical protein
MPEYAKNCTLPTHQGQNLCRTFWQRSREIGLFYPQPPGCTETSAKTSAAYKGWQRWQRF